MKKKSFRKLKPGHILVKFDLKTLKETYYYPNGNVYSIIERNDKGQHHGERKYFHKNGELEEHSFWKNGNHHGEHKLFYENGKLKARLFFKNGKFHGECKWFDENGELRGIVQYDNHIGLGKFFEENGDT